MIAIIRDPPRYTASCIVYSRDLARASRDLFPIAIAAEKYRKLIAEKATGAGRQACLHEE